MNITIEDFAKIEIKIGTVLEAIKIPEGDRLLKLIFDFGSAEQNSSKEQNAEENIGNIKSDLQEKYPRRDVRQVMSAIAQAFPDPTVLVGRQIAVITNLEPRKFRGYESQGMIMATGTPEEGIVFLSPEKPVQPGSKVK